MTNSEQLLRAAIAELARQGCDLTDAAVNDGDRAENASFYADWLEQRCGFRLTLNQVIEAAHLMTRETQRASLTWMFNAAPNECVAPGRVRFDRQLASN